MSQVTKETLKDSKGNIYATDVEVETFDAVAFSPSDALAAAIQSGDVSTGNRTVEFQVKDKAGNVTKVFRQAYTQCEAKSRKGAIALPGIDGDEAKLWAFASSRADATVYQPVYVSLRNAGEGPEKAVERINKLLGNLTPEQRAAAKAALGIA